MQLYSKQYLIIVGHNLNIETCIYQAFQISFGQFDFNRSASQFKF